MRHPLHPPPAAEAALQLWVTLPIKPDHLAGFLATMHREVAGARSEAGNVAFDVYADRDQPSTLYLFEHWRNAAALASHVRQPYYKAIRAQEKDDLGGTPSERPLGGLGSSGRPHRIGQAGEPAVLSLIAPREGMRAQLLLALEQAGAATATSAGNRGFHLLQDRDSADEVLLIERWATPEARDAYLSTAAGQALQEALAALAATPVKVTRMIDRSQP
ncbi:MAG: (4S)-4-hydroxy-5-phosphonooxypentane-2,3-dione isomerase [Stenotrophomonas maltophilia]|uniref:(4S)-4-hydroxy-5-phosphonooxypentane-2,3-dione isomerase n=1 Tax=Stenotrophomonas maltophilia TaxID=40324 RepID=A0A7V8FH59_STEMA|nr:MAG: (4S)-4-hydroxy-5-phosphonooxypentane-2,3-dione isomerase [Stenotrophomonas maltophilia]